MTNTSIASILAFSLVTAAGAGGAFAGNGKAKVTFTASTDGALISEIITSYNVTAYDGTPLAGGAETRPLCEAPCSFEIEPGYVRLQVTGDSIMKGEHGFNLEADRPTHIAAETGSAGRFLGGCTLAALGILSTIAGGVIVGVSGSGAGYALLFPGIIGTGVGFGLAMSSMTSLALAPGAETGEVAARGVRYGGTF